VGNDIFALHTIMKCRLLNHDTGDGESGGESDQDGVEALAEDPEAGPEVNLEEEDPDVDPVDSPDPPEFAS
jgi:hypothetical protein